MPQCDCSLKHANGGVCNCLDNNPLPDWDNFDDVEDEDWKDVKIEEDDDTTKITKPWDDFLH